MLHVYFTNIGRSTESKLYRRFYHFSQIIFLIYLLYLKLGWSAVVGSACCIAIMIPLQFVVGKKMSSNSKDISVMHTITTYTCFFFIHYFCFLTFDAHKKIRKSFTKRADFPPLYISITCNDYTRTCRTNAFS